MLYAALTSFVLSAAASDLLLWERVDLVERCAQDQIYDSNKAIGRNQWALNCHLISQVDYDCAMSNGYYWTFLSTSGVWSEAPVYPGESCTGFRKFTLCPEGCFESSQRVQFGKVYMTPESAYHAGQTTVTALSEDATFHALSLTEEPIGVYVKGPEKADVVRIQTTRGQTLTVTRNHPLVDGTGVILPAEEVRVGLTVLTQQGPSPVIAVDKVAYAGLVWNFRPVKATPRANIHIAEDFLTGSIRYQNEWANQASRLLLRQELSPSGL